MKNFKILICGDIKVGKSTLIEKLIAELSEKPKGYITVRLPAREEKSRVYLYDIANPPECVEDAEVIMDFTGESVKKFPEKLDTTGVSYLENISAGSLVVLDEIGTLESKAPKFQQAVMDILSGPYRVLASVKAQNTEFLRAVRAHEDCELYIITPGNRDELFRQLCKEISE